MFFAQADGSLRPTAADAEVLLGEALALDARQALALHLHVHLAEAAAPQRCAAPPGSAQDHRTVLGHVVGARVRGFSRRIEQQYLRRGTRVMALLEGSDAVAGWLSIR